MSRSNRPGQRPIAGVCPCHGTAPHKYEPRAQAAETTKNGRRPRKPGKGPRKPGRFPVRGAQKGGSR